MGTQRKRRHDVCFGNYYASCSGGGGTSFDGASCGYDASFDGDVSFGNGALHSCDDVGCDAVLQSVDCEASLHASDDFVLDDVLLCDGDGFLNDGGLLNGD